MPSKPEKPTGEVRRVRRVPKKGPAKTIEIAAEEAVSMEEYVSPVSARPVTSFPLMGVRHKDVTVFLRQLIMLLEAGTPILRSLDTLATRSDRAGVRALVSDIARYVEGGNPLWQAFERHRAHFGPVFVNLIKASEASGTLVPVLQRIVDYRERREILRKRVQGAMVYPAILLLACLGVVLIISKVLIPQFQELFARLEHQLPAGTLRFIAVTDFFGRYWLWFVGIIVALYVVHVFIARRNPLYRLRSDALKLRIPVIGPILRKHAIVELTRTMSLMLRSGLSMMVTLDLTRNVIHNRAVAHVLQGVRDSVERGSGIEGALRSSRVIPGVVTDMLVTGEESGAIDRIADQIAKTYEEEVNIAIGTLGETLVPILTVLIGVVVLVLFYNLFLPMLKMMETLQGVGAGAAAS